ncbi:MAG TPA: alpha/beta hydrolase-fold protein [Acidimicrobiales bacterium]|nr:alpha/beta hydrolase-fold protein [Acidimicrobiales bacterium]
MGAAPWSPRLSGRVDERLVDSAVLASNPLGDPTVRPLWVYVPPGYDDEPARRYPSVYVLQGFAGFVTTWGNRQAFRPTFPERVDDLFASRRAPPCIVAFVDAWTAYGGSQFVDSPGTGKYHSYLCDEVVAFVDEHYRTVDAPAHRGVMGKSSGGFGAMITPMLRPDLFGALATHAGDALYEYLYIPEFAKAVRALRAWDGSITRWWDDFRAREAFSRPDDHTLLMVLAIAACFSATDEATPVLPFDATTGVLVDDVWRRWLAWDPVRMVHEHADALRGLTAVWIDGGTSDEWYLDLGAAAFRDALAAIGVGDVHFELFDGRHGGIDHRYAMSLAYLADRLAPR